MNSKKKKETGLRGVASSAFSRGASLVGMGMASGARFLSYKVSQAISQQDDSGDRLNKYLLDQAQILVNELGKLKGSAMKVGQILSMYGEQFLPAEVNQVLKKLQSESEPVHWSVMQKVLLRQLGQERLDDLEIVEEPLAAASLGQVYLAYRKSDGKKLALKVQYPGVDKAIDTDLAVLKKLLSVTNLLPKGHSYDELFKELRMVMHYESDYEREARTIEEYHKKLDKYSHFVIPQVFPKYSTKRILCMSFEDGIPLDSDEVLQLPQVRRNKIGIHLMDLLAKEIFKWRTVQTDPHFGNYKIRLSDAGDQIVLLDFGAVRKFPKKYIQSFSHLAEAAINRDRELALTRALEIGFLLESDDNHARELFINIVMEASEAFEKKYHNTEWEQGNFEHCYPWDDTDLVGRLHEKTRDAVFTFKLRPPPREMVFINRKLVGTYFMIRRLGIKFGPREIMSRYLELNV